MKKILLLTVLTISFFSCSSDNDDEGTIDVKFNKNEIEVNAKETANLTINMENPEDCKFYSDDEFICEINYYSFSNSIDLDTKHVGETTVYVEYKGKTDKCKVIVKPLYDYIGNPVLELGISKAELKKKVNGTIESESADRIEYKEKDKTVYDTYIFESDKLVLVYSSVNINTSILNITNSLRERYEYVSASSKTYWFSRPNVMVVRMTERGGNGGYGIIYARNAEVINTYFN